MPINRPNAGDVVKANPDQDAVYDLLTTGDAGQVFSGVTPGTPGVWQTPVSPEAVATPTTDGTVRVDQAMGGDPVAITTASRDDPGSQGVAPLGSDGLVSSLRETPPLSPGTVAEVGRWVRYSGNPVLSPSVAWEQTWLEEPNVLFDGGIYKMWYTGGVGTAAAIGYATSSDGIAWTKYASNPVLGQGASGVSGFAEEVNVLKVGDTFWMYYAYANTNLQVATSSDGITWTVRGTALAPQSGVSQWANSTVFIDPSGIWHMLVEGLHSGTWQIFGAQSADGLLWTLTNGGAALSTLSLGGGYSGPAFTDPPNYEGLYHVYYHAATSGSLPTDIYHATSPDLITWTHANSGTPIITHPGGTYDQAADPCVREVYGVAMLWFEDAQNSPSYAAHINLALPGCTLAEVLSGAPVPPAGTVTSVALTVPADESVTGSPLTGAGTLAITRNAQSGNKGLFSPADGSSGIPGFRALVAADIPAPAPVASSLLVLLPNPYNFVADTSTDYGQPPDFITTAAGDVIGVAGM